MADPHRKHRVLTLCERLKFIKAVEDSPFKSRTQMAIHFGVSLPTLSNIMKNKNKYLAQARSGDVVTTSKRARGYQLASVDKSLQTGLRHAAGLFSFFPYEFLFVD